ncbi:MAG: hypothetical protein Q7O66_07340 [Dehalococcoidia bacterium]|nr:hypothetical protein [Dehalococcoidia bacterium]
MAELTAEQRKKLHSSSFVFPKDRSYPIDTEARARAALAMVHGARSGKSGTLVEIAAVEAAVHKKYPGIDQETPLQKIKRGLAEGQKKGR